MAQSPPSCRRLYQTSRRHPRTYILTFSNSSPSDTHRRIFTHLSTTFLTIAFTLALPTFTVTPTPTPTSDPAHRVTHPTIFSRLSTSILTFSRSGGALPPKSPHTPTSDSDSPPRITYSTTSSPLSTSILTFLEAMEPNLQRHPYNNIRFGFHSSPYLPFDFLPPPYLHFNYFLKRWSLTSNVTPTPTSDSDSPPRLTYPTIFSDSLPPF